MYLIKMIFNKCICQFLFSQSQKEMSFVFHIKAAVACINVTWIALRCFACCINKSIMSYS